MEFYGMYDRTMVLMILKKSYIESVSVVILMFTGHSSSDSKN